MQTLSSLFCFPPYLARVRTSHLKFCFFIVQLPDGAKVTPDCQDLLLALLQRDPLARISFDDFFAHPFLDLEHVPSPVCLEKAVSAKKSALIRLTILIS